MMQVLHTVEKEDSHERLNTHLFFLGNIHGTKGRRGKRMKNKMLVVILVIVIVLKNVRKGKRKKN